jgi:hypothetical protein
MKKISSLIVCFALLAAGTAFALDLPDALKIPGLTVTGDVRTGLQVSGGTVDDYGKLYDADLTNAPETGAIDPKVFAFSDDLGTGVPFRAQLQLVWERDKLGVKTRFRYQPAASNVLTDKLSDLNTTVNKAFVYANLLDNKVKVSLGKGTDEAWGLFYSNFGSGPTSGFDGNDGVKLEVKPIDGLNIGAHYGAGNLFGNAPDYKEDTTSADRRLVVGAKYTSDIFGAIVSTTHNFSEPDEDKNTHTYQKGKGPYDATENIGTPLVNTSNLLVGAWVKPIDPLRIDLSLIAVNLGSRTISVAYTDGKDDPTSYKKGDYNPYWAIYPKLKVGYTLSEQLSVGLAFTDIVIADGYYFAETDPTKVEDSGAGSLFPITINPSVGYTINDDISVSLDLNLKINLNGSDQFGIGFKPAAEFSLGSGATFVVYDELTFYTKANDDADFRAKHPNFEGANYGASGTANTLQFDFVWTF